MKLNDGVIDSKFPHDLRLIVLRHLCHLDFNHLKLQNRHRWQAMYVIAFNQVLIG